MKARVLIAVIVLCLNSVVAGQAMQRAENDPPVVVIRGKYYSLKDLVGFSRSEFSKSYAECASKLSDAALKEQILAYARGAESRRLIQDETDRARLEQLGLEQVIRYEVQQVILFPLAAAMLDVILERHGTRLEDYFDPQKLRDSLTKRAAIDDMILKMFKDGSDPDEIAGHVNDTFKEFIRNPITTDTVQAITSRREGRLSPVGWRNQFFSGNGTIKNDWIRGTILYHLIKQVAEDGTYYRKLGKADFVRRSSTLYKLEINGYLGNAEVVDNLAEATVSEDGTMAGRGTRELVRWLNRFDVGVKADVSTAIGERLIDQWHTDPDKFVGRAYSPIPQTYYILAWDKQLNVDQVKDMVFRGLALNMLEKDYDFDFRVLLPILKNVDKGLSRASGVPYIMLMGVHLAWTNDFIKQPYPAEYFDDWKRNQGKMQTFLMRAALVSIQKDAEAADALMSELAEAEKNAATQVTARTYRKIHEELKKECE